MKNALKRAPQSEQDKVLLAIIKGDPTIKNDLGWASKGWGVWGIHGQIKKKLAAKRLTEAEGEMLVKSYRRLKEKGVV